MEASAPAPTPPPPSAPLYPARLDIEYQDRPLNRLTTFFRIFTVIPILILLASITGYSNTYGAGSGSVTVVVSGTGLLVAPVFLMILFREKYPRWWFDWNVQFVRFLARIEVYLYLIDDRYPSTDEEQAVRLDLDYPDVRNDLNRWLPLVKWFLAIPHYIVLFFLYIGAFFVVVISWFAILFTGRMPRWAFDYLLGVGRWHLRVAAYAFILITDRYPPFSLDPA
jgi:hypothetical protein